MKKNIVTPTLRQNFETLSTLIEKHLPQKKGKTLTSEQVVAILETHQRLQVSDLGMFGIVDYSTFNYIFLTDNLSHLDIDRRLALQEGVPHIIKMFHPDEISIVFEKIIPAVISFLGKQGDPYHLKNAKAAFTTRLRLKTGEYRWFVHQMRTIYSDENNTPLLGLKSLFEVEGIKSSAHLDLILSIRDQDTIYQTVHESSFPIVSKESVLSAREMEILQLISAGKTSKEIAHILGISINTVHNHRGNIMKKKNGVSMPATIFTAAKEQLL